MRTRATIAVKALCILGIAAGLSGCALLITLGGGPCQAFSMGNYLTELCDTAYCPKCARGRTVIDKANPAAAAGTVQEWYVQVSGPETIKLKILRDDGAGHYVLVGESDLESAVAGLNSFECSIPDVEAGDFIGLYVEGSGTSTVRAEAGGSLPYAHIGDVTGETLKTDWFPASGIVGPFSIYAIGCGVQP